MNTHTLSNILHLSYRLSDALARISTRCELLRWGHLSVVACAHCAARHCLVSTTHIPFCSVGAYQPCQFFFVVGWRPSFTGNLEVKASFLTGLAMRAAAAFVCERRAPRRGH